MMREDDHDQQREPKEPGQRAWRAEFEFPDPEMGNHFQEWWESEGWWSFRSWYEQNLGANCQWEQFMRKLCQIPPDDSKVKPVAQGNEGKNY